MPSDVLTNLSALRETLDAAEDTVQNVTDETARDELIGWINNIRTVLSDASGAADADAAKMARMMAMLVSAKGQIDALKAEVEKLTTPPSAYGYFIRLNGDKTADIFHHNQRFKVNVPPSVAKEDLKCGARVVVNEALNIVAVDKTQEEIGFEVKVSAFIGEDIIRVTNRFDEINDCLKADALKEEKLKEGDVLLSNGLFVFKKLVKSKEIERLFLAEVPQVTYEEIGGLNEQKSQIQELVEWPYLYAKEFKEHGLKPPKGILLYGPPGCGKTLIAKALANALAKKAAEIHGQNAKSYFLNIKGPELLSKWVGNTEAAIREAFSRVKELASEKLPVIMFWDEFESLFKTRGTGISSDIQDTIVPQFTTEMDGVENLENVIVIAATNRQDRIDPAVIRPGRFDTKIEIPRPDFEQSRQIFSVYLKPNELLLHPQYFDSKNYEGDYYVPRDGKGRPRQNRAGETVKHLLKKEPALIVAYLIQTSLERIFDKTRETNQLMELIYDDNTKETLCFSDFNSGATVASVVNKAKWNAFRTFMKTGVKGLARAHFMTAIEEEFKSQEDLPNVSDPNEWAKILGKRKKIAHVKSLTDERKRRLGEKEKPVVQAPTGHYL